MSSSGFQGVSRRGLLRGGLGIAAAGILAAACGDDSTADVTAPIKAEPDGDITWFTWAEYVDPAVVEGFEKKYGVKVQQTYFDSDDAMIAKLAAGLPYDVITTNSAYMTRAIQGKLLRPYDITALKNYDELVDYFRNPAYDSGELRYSVPYSGGPTGIVYREDKVKVTGSWNDLWNNPEAKGHIYVLDQIEETIGLSLLRQGASLHSDNPDEVAAAVDELIKLKPQLGGISTDTQNNVASGNAWIHHAWSTDAYMLMTNSPVADKLNFQTTREGVPFGMDLLSIGAKAKSPGTALLFIDWLLEPENSAANVRYVGQLAGTKTGDATYREVVKDFPSLQLPENFYETAQWKESLTGARQQLWTQQWNRFKA